VISPPASRLLIASALSLLWPGVGHFQLRHWRIGAIFFLPTLLIMAGLFSLILPAVTGDAISVALRLLDPIVALWAMALIAFSLLWRLAAAGLIVRHVPLQLRQTWLLAIGAVVICVLHLALLSYAWSFYDAGSRIFGDAPAAAAGAQPFLSGDPRPGITGEPNTTVSPRPSQMPTDRMTWLLVGLDSAPGREATLTDTLLVFSVDPDEGTGVMVSFPRDIAEFPLYDGGIYTGKINSFYTYAENHRERYPDGGMDALRQQLSFLLGIDINYHASLNLSGFERMIDLVGGVDVVNPRPIDDPALNGGFTLPAGPLHLDGDLALLYVRSRKGEGDSDFTRAARQQQVVLALREKLLDGDALTQLPSLLSAASRVVNTNFPAGDSDEVLAVFDALRDGRVRRVILDDPYTWHPPEETTGGAWILRLDLEQLAQLSLDLFDNESHYDAVD